MLFFPSAKLNLGLFVTGKRPDGFHDLESVFVPIQWTDILELHAVEGPPGSLAMEYTGLAIPGVEAGGNLVERAHRLLVEAGRKLPALSGRLHKVVPMGAGLGGGSADGAWMLRAIDRVTGWEAGAEGQRPFAEALGSDCPFFLQDGPAFVHGRGEHIEPIGDALWTEAFVAVVHPGVHVSTKEAFGRLAVRPAPMDLRRLAALPVKEWHAAGVGNDFTPGVAASVPAVADALALVADGALYSQMTGTGSAVFGLYPTWEAAARAADGAALRGWATWFGPLGSAH